MNRNDPRQAVRLVFLPFIISSGVLCFWDEFFFGRSLFSTGRYVLGTTFLGPIGQEAKAKTAIISGLAVTAGQFLVIIGSKSF